MLRRLTDLPQQIAGYEVEAELGRGGMGVVYKARHLALKRTVALKMVLAGAYAGPDERTRFQREAESVAALRHANVVQIHDVGEADGRPYFTMEYVEGGSLAQKLAGTPQPSREAAALVATLAGAVKAAHDSGIVHRDLKPANVLLTPDGTPKVSDFGLARRMSGDAALTWAGAAVGTPSYMAPEQAHGQPGTVGPASDIYSLGAILYECLTGRPPFRAETATETLRQVTSQDPAPPSRLNRTVPRDLETICLKCLQKAPPHRYATAQALADDLKRFDEGRPILARPVGWPTRLWRWGRRNPAPVTLLTAFFALLLLALGGVRWLELQHAGRQVRAQEAIEAALIQVPGLRHQGRWPEARALLTQCTSRLDEAGSASLERQVTEADANLELAATLEQIRLTPAIRDYRTFDYQAMSKAYAQAFHNAELDIGENQGTVADRIRASELRPELIMALDHWAFVADEGKDQPLMARLLNLARRADPDPAWGDRIRESALGKDKDRLRHLAKEAWQRLAGKEAGDLPSMNLVLLLARQLGYKDEAEAMLRAAQWRHPDDFWLNFTLGEAFRERKPAEAVGFYRAALVTRPAVAYVHLELSLALLRQRNVDEATQSAHKAVELVPALPVVHHQLGLCLQDGDHFDEAIAAYRHAIQLDPDKSRSHYQVGLCLLVRGEVDQAMAEARKVLDLEPDSAVGHHLLGMCLQDTGRFQEAIAEFQVASKLDETLAHPHNQIGLCYRVTGPFDKEIAAYRSALEIDPGLAQAHFNLGVCWQDRGRLENALPEFRRAVELDPRGGQGHVSLVETLLHTGRFAAARTAIRYSLEVLPANESRREALREKLQLCERLFALESRLPALLKGAEQPDAAELVKLADLSRDFGRTHAAVELYLRAFAAQPARLDLDRYNAACAAALAGTGAGADAAVLGDPERARLRRQALDWLRPLLALQNKHFESGKSVAGTLSFWQQDIDLVDVRDAAALRNSPPTSARTGSDSGRTWRSCAADPLEQGLTHATRRQWTAAAEAYTRAMKRDPPEEGHLWFEYASILLLADDRPGYSRACADMIEACGKANGPRGYHVARACTLAEDGSADAARAGRLAEKELQASPRAFWSLTEQGALHYRAGRFAQAVSLFEQSLRADARPGRAALNWLWLALAQHRLGKADEARRWLDKATVWLDQFRDGMPGRADGEFGLHLHNWLEAHVLRREAESIILPKPPISN